MSIELFVGVNLAADAVLIAAACRALGCLRWRRVLFAAFLCALYAAIAAARPRPWAGLPAQLALLAGVAWLLSAGSGPRLWLRMAALLCGGALLAGGASRLTMIRGPAACLCAGYGAALLALMVAARHPLRGDFQVFLEVCAAGRTVRFPALIDTGNRLREPLSGLPVLIAERPLLSDALPETGWREIRFSAVGGGGSMACFRPSGLWIERGRRRRRAPEVWIALSPAPLPGSARALAPAEFAGFL